MAVVWLRLRAEMRARPVGLAALVLLVALTGGAAMAAAAGSARTESALARGAAAARVTHTIVITRTPNRSTGPEFSLSEIRGLPQVSTVYEFPYTYYRATVPSGQVITYSDLPIHIATDVRVGRTLDRLQIVAGRMSNPAAADEIVVSQPDAERLGLKVGTRIPTRFGAQAQQPGLSLAVNKAGTDPAKVPYLGPRVTLNVVGIYAGLGTIALDFGYGRFYRPAVLTPAFLELHREAVKLPIFYARLRHGPDDLPAFGAALGALKEGGETSLQPTGSPTVQFERGTTIKGIALGVLAALVAALGLALAGQGLARRSVADADDRETLRALGVTRRQRFGVGVGRAALVGLLGATLGVGVAVALSPVFPADELARLAEPDPGVHINFGVLATGAVLTLLGVVLVGLHPAWRAAQPPAPWAPRARGPRRWLARSGIPLTAALGALGSRHSRAMLALMTGALALIVVALTCVASFDRLTETPAWYGRNYDATVGGGGAGSVVDSEPRLRSHPLVGTFIGASRTQVTLGGQPVGLLGLAPGAIGPTVLEGRAPKAPDEIMLGTRTAADAGVEPGDQVTVFAAGKDHRLRVVGRGVVPSLTDNLRLGHGAIVTFAGLRTLVPRAVFTYQFVRFNTEFSRASVPFAREYGPKSVPVLPADLVNVRAADSAATLSVALLALIGATALLYALAIGTRSRRRDLAILKTLGLLPRQLAAVVAWRATSEATLALAIGLPLGVLAGRWVWSEAAGQLGVQAEVTVPFGWLAVVIIAAVALANLVALPAARAAVRIKPARVLRAE